MTLPEPKNPGDRTKAHRLRRLVKAGTALSTMDALWLADYEEKDARQRQHASGAPDVGASRAGRKINFQLEEQAEAVGTGQAATAAATAATAALVVKEEGRRLDALLINAVDAMKESAAINRETALMIREDYGAIFEMLIKRAEVLESTHIEMLHTVRTHFLQATQMEGALLNKDAEGDPSTAMLVALLAKHFGVEIPAAALPAVAAAAAKRKAPPPNGATS